LSSRFEGERAGRIAAGGLFHLELSWLVGCYDKGRLCEDDDKCLAMVEVKRKAEAALQSDGAGGGEQLSFFALFFLRFRAQAVGDEEFAR